jgi:peptide/nickel transport system substrate-binding protein
MLRNKLMSVVGLLIIASLILGACQQATPTPQEIIKTVVVTQAGQEIVKTVVVTQEAPTAPAPAEAGPIPAEGLVACNPVPEIASAGGNGAHLAKVVDTNTAPAAKESSAAAAKPYVLAPNQQAGTVYRVGVFEDITSDNYWAANGPDNTVYNSYMLPPRLTMYGLSEKYFTLVQTVAAETVPELTQEGDMWVAQIKMRDDISWSDGTPFTANDVAFTANAVIGIGLISGNWATWYDSNFIDHVEAVDDYTVKYVFHSKPGLSRYQYGVLQAPILSEQYWSPVFDEAMAPINALAADASEDAVAAAQAEAQDNLFAHTPDGEPLAGSFLFSKWEKAAFLENTANPDFYDRGLEIQQWPNGAYEDSSGQTVGTPEGDVETTINVGPNVDSVVYTIYGSQDAAILALKNGEVDFVLNSLGLQRGLANQIRTDPNLTVLENPTNGFRYLSFNVRRRPMNDCAFRQAVAVLIDKEFVTQTILQGAAFPLYTFVPEGNTAWYYADTPKLGQGLTREQRTNLALAILELAGYTWEGDQKPSWSDEGGGQVVPAGGGLIMPDGTPVPELHMPAPSPGYDPLRSTFAIWIETWLNEFGIPLKADLAGFNVIVPVIFTEQNFDMYILGWSLSIFPDFLHDFFSEEQAAQDGNNAGGYVNPDFESLSGGLLTCDTVEACKQIADESQNMLGTELPYVILFDTGIIEAYRSAAVSYPFEDALAGLQYYHQGPNSTLQAEVNVK